MPGPINDEKVACILAEAVMAGDKATSEKYGVSLRSIQRWRSELSQNDDLASVVAAKKAVAEREWADNLPDAISNAIDFLSRACRSTNTSDPAMIHSVAGALKILTDVAISKKLVDARLSRQVGQAGEAVRPSAGAGDGNAKVVAIR